MEYITVSDDPVFCWFCKQECAESCKEMTSSPFSFICSDCSKGLHPRVYDSLTGQQNHYKQVKKFEEENGK
jgi:hypothetical protein